MRKAAYNAALFLFVIVYPLAGFSYRFVLEKVMAIRLSGASKTWSKAPSRQARELLVYPGTGQEKPAKNLHAKFCDRRFEAESKGVFPNGASDETQKASFFAKKKNTLLSRWILCYNQTVLSGLISQGRKVVWFGENCTFPTGVV